MDYGSLRVGMEAVQLVWDLAALLHRRLQPRHSVHHRPLHPLPLHRQPLHH